MDERLKKLNDKIEKLKHDRLRTNSEVQKCVIDKEIEKLNIESKLIKDNIKQPEKVEPKESLVVEKSPDEGFVDKTVNGVEDPIIKEEESEENDINNEEDSDLPNSFMSKDYLKYNKHNKNNKHNNK